jgi:hypothetical protein
MRKIGMTLVVGLVLVASLARAEEPACVTAYRTEHGRFFKVLSDLKTERDSANIGGVLLGGTAYAICVLRTKSYLGCGALLGGAVVAGAAFSQEAQAKMKKIEDSRRIYEVYYETQIGTNGTTAEAKDLFAALEVSADNQAEILAAVRRMMESGELCADGKPAATWDDLKAKLKAAQITASGAE